MRRVEPRDRLGTRATSNSSSKKSGDAARAAIKVDTGRDGTVGSGPHSVRGGRPHCPVVWGRTREREREIRGTSIWTWRRSESWLWRAG